METKRMSTPVAVTDDSFELEIEKHEGLVVVDFWAAGAGRAARSGRSWISWLSSMQEKQKWRR